LSWCSAAYQDPGDAETSASSAEASAGRGVAEGGASPAADDVWGGVGEPRLAHELLERAAALWPDRKSTRLNSSHNPASRMPSSA
jgi:hypothetical protein